MFSIAAAPSLGTFYPPVRSSLYLPTVSINFRPKCVPLSLTVYRASQFISDLKEAHVKNLSKNCDERVSASDG